ncbi:hypothetical protein Hanom_Chr03g00255831 [Helianthus anomalus]
MVTRFCTSAFQQQIKHKYTKIINHTCETKIQIQAQKQLMPGGPQQSCLNWCGQHFPLQEPWQYGPLPPWPLWQQSQLRPFP